MTETPGANTEARRVPRRVVASRANKKGFTTVSDATFCMFGVSSAELVTILPVLIIVILLLGLSYALFLMYRGSSEQ
jgi:hypothetical protein